METASPRSAAASVARRLCDRGHRALFAGGAVRDRILRESRTQTIPREAEADVDVATSAVPAEVLECFDRTLEVGAQFGVVVVLDFGPPVEVATFRTDLGYEDGRHPVGVRFVDAREDALRRDFTINGMFEEPETGEIIDYVGGREDLERGLVRAIGDARERFGEDRLRMLRAVRFAARLGFEIEAATFAAMREMASEVRSVSAERVGDEMARMLTEGGAGRAIRLLDECGLLRAVLPEIDAMHGVEQGRAYHPEGDVFLHTAKALDALDARFAGEGARATETLAFGVLLHDVAKPECAAKIDGRITFYGHCERGAERADEICRRLRRSRAVCERVSWLVRNHLRVVDAPNMRLSTLKRFLRQEGIDELLELVRIDALASSGDLQYYEFCVEQREKLAEEWRPEPLLKGRDLIAMGYEPGPRFAEILHAVEEAQLEGVLEGPERARDWVREHFPK